MFFASLLGLAGCGGSSAEGPPPSNPENVLTITEAAPTTTQAAPPSRAERAHKGFVASLTASGHTALVGHPWRFTISTHTRTRKPVGGTIIAQVLLGGKVIDTVGWFKYSRVLSREYTYGDADRGKTVTFRARIIAEGATRDLTYAVKVI